MDHIYIHIHSYDKTCVYPGLAMCRHCWWAGLQGPATLGIRNRPRLGLGRSLVNQGDVGQAPKEIMFINNGFYHIG